MKNLILLSALTALSISIQAQQEKVLHDEHAQARSVHGFHAISISGGIDLYLTQGPEAVAISASREEYRDKIQTVVEAGVLKIFLRNTGSISWGFHNPAMKAYVSVTTLDNLQASGGSDVYLQGMIKADDLNIHLSGGSDMKGGEVVAGKLSIVQTGGSDVSISGKVGDLKIQASGGSDMKSYDLVTETCSIEASGGSDAEITVNKELKVNASGGSDVYYKGSAVIRDLKSSGSSSVQKRG